jgi:glycosyltransferase involved in cell wall biosynthesis
MAGSMWAKPVIQMVITDIERVRRAPLAWRALMRAEACGVRGPMSAGKLKAAGFRGTIEILHNAVELPPPPAERSPPCFDLLAAGTNCPAKDYPWMLEIIAEVRDAMPSLSVAIAGRGVGRLAAEVERRNLRDCVTLMGELTTEALFGAYRASRALLLTSLHEGLPMVALEAMSCGLPVFGTDVGEMPWRVDRGKDGWLVRHGDTDGMVKALLSALRNWDRMRSASGAARAKYCRLAEQFTPASIALRWQRLLDAATGAAEGTQATPE